MKLKIYIAGPLNGDTCVYVQNLHRMIKTADEVRNAGFAVFVPGMDILMGITMGYYEYADYFDNSQPWLEVADAVFLCKGWKESQGTRREIEQAKRSNIPVFEDLDKLTDWGRENDKKNEQ